MRVFLVILLLLTSCATDPVASRMRVADEIAQKVGMEKSLVKTSGFSIMSYSRITKPDAPVNIYIECDGFAWAAQGRLSTNPSPRNPVALKLASADDSDNVVYLARPCQYVNFADTGLCEAKYWHISKHSKLVIDSMGQAIDKIKARNKLVKINLIGYSGGGDIVAILAATRDDVATLRTVAGNLDIDAFSKHHRVDMLTDSLNASDYIDRLVDIPQLLISGSDDTVVPPFIAQDFADKVNKKHGCARVKVLDGVNHHKGWYPRWKELLAEPVCGNKNAS